MARGVEKRKRSHNHHLWNYLSLAVPLLAAISSISHVEGFHSRGSLLKPRSPLTSTSPATQRRRGPPKYAYSNLISNLRFRSEDGQKKRPFSSPFFVAATSERSLFNEKNSLNINFENIKWEENEGDDVPWECVIDPNSHDQCYDYLDRSKMTEFGTWAKKEEDDEVTLMDKLSLAAFATAGISTFALLLLFSGPGSWRFFLAGGLCAAASHAIPTPIDVVKTKKQVDPELQGLGFVKATQKIIKDEGVGALLAGLGPTIWGYLLEGSMKFGVYEVLKPPTIKMLSALATATSLSFLRSQLIAFMVCGFIAGTAASVVLCPMEALRIRLVAEPDFAPKGWVQGGRRMIRKEGVLSLWRGIAPQIYKQVPYTVTKNVSFDFFTRIAYGIAIGSGFALNHATKFTIPFVSAILASILSCVSSQPGDMLLSLVCAHQGENRTTNAIARDIMRSERGIRGFFVGMKSRMYHVGIIVTLQLVLYDVLKRLCGGMATGAA